MFFPLFSLLNATVLSATVFEFSLKSIVPFDFAPEFRQTYVQASSYYRLLPVKSQFSSKNRYLSYSAQKLQKKVCFPRFPLD